MNPVRVGRQQPQRLPAGRVVLFHLEGMCRPVSEPYVVLARKYRPRVPADLIGQEPIVNALNHAFASGRLPQALMLTGIRGTGKTTTARIIAAGLNCTGGPRPTASPCGACPQCKAVGHHPDTVEIDAASNTGVDHVREMIEAVRYRPVDARYKVFIIDEVHMLSKPAFNALLKTLEEPPPHAVFILATTELHKVPVTVLSRCRRLPLRRVDASVLRAHILAVAAKEGIACAADAAEAMAKAAEGSVRDALTLLDQAGAAAGGGAITRAAVDDMLGLCSPEKAADVLEAVFAGRPGEACALAEAMVSAGTEPRRVLTVMLDVLTALLKLRVGASTPEPFPVSEALEAQLRRLAGQISAPECLRAWQLLAKLYDESMALPEGLNVLEHALLRLSYASELPPVATLLAAVTGSPAPPRAQTPLPVTPPPPVAAPRRAPASPSENALRVFPDAVIRATSDEDEADSDV